MTYFWLHNEIYTSWQTGLTSEMTFLTSWPIFDVMTYFWRIFDVMKTLYTLSFSDVFLTSRWTFDVATYFLTSWLTFLCHDESLDVMTHFWTSWCNFVFDELLDIVTYPLDLLWYTWWRLDILFIIVDVSLSIFIMNFVILYHRIEINFHSFILKYIQESRNQILPKLKKKRFIKKSTFQTGTPPPPPNEEFATLYASNYRHIWQFRPTRICGSFAGLLYCLLSEMSSDMFCVV